MGSRIHFGTEGGAGADSVIRVTVPLWFGSLLSTVLLKHYFFGMAG
jgi:hypothetical protein